MTTIEPKVEAGDPKNGTTQFILSADIQGWTIIQDEDKNAASEMATVFAQVAKAALLANRGQVIAIVGDGILGAFENAHDAITCGIALQDAFRTKTIPRTDQGGSFRIELRIGIDVGMVTRSETNSFFGLPLHVATRLQSIGQPNSILITEAVYIMIRNDPSIKTRIVTDYHSFKGIAHPTAIYCIVATGLIEPVLHHSSAYRDKLSLSYWSTSSWKQGVLAVIAVLCFGITPFALYRVITISVLPAEPASIVANVPEANAQVEFDRSYTTAISAGHVGVALLVLYMLVMQYRRYRKDLAKLRMETVKQTSNEQTTEPPAGEKPHAPELQADADLRMIAAKLKTHWADMIGFKIRAVEGTSQFMICFGLFWLSILGLYLTLFLAAVLTGDYEPSAIVLFISTLFNNLSTASLIAATTILFYRRSDKVKSHVHWPTMWITGLVVLLLTVAEVIVIGKSEGTSDYFLRASGFWASVAVGALVARLDSRLISLDFTVVMLLLMYVACQALFTSIKQADMPLLNASLTMVLMGKAVLSLIVLWLVDTKKMVYYFLRMNWIMDNSERIWFDVRDRL